MVVTRLFTMSGEEYKYFDADFVPDAANMFVYICDEGDGSVMAIFRTEDIKMVTNERRDD